MISPSATQLQAVLAATMGEAEDVAMADRAYDEAQEAVAALRPQADELIEDVVASLTAELRSDCPQSAQPAQEGATQPAADHAHLRHALPLPGG